MSAGQRMTPAELFYHARRFVLFLLVIALFVQSSVLILLNAMRIDEQVIRRNAPQALINILLLGMVFFVLDSLRRRYTVDRHVRRIIQGLQQIQAGDFSVRIAPIDRNVRVNELDQVIDGINRMTMELAGVETLRAQDAAGRHGQLCRAAAKPCHHAGAAHGIRARHLRRRAAPFEPDRQHPAAQQAG